MAKKVKKAAKKVAKKKPTKSSQKAKAPKAKTSKRSSPEKQKPAAKSKLPAVRVRMYRQGLGDCFLITFNSNNENPNNHCHLLIDCGTLGNKSTDATMAQVADSIHETIDAGGHTVVIATHEHKDHLSGF